MPPSGLPTPRSPLCGPSRPASARARPASSVKPPCRPPRPTTNRRAPRARRKRPGSGWRKERALPVRRSSRPFATEASQPRRPMTHLLTLPPIPSASHGGAQHLGHPANTVRNLRPPNGHLPRHPPARPHARALTISRTLRTTHPLSPPRSLHNESPDTRPPPQPQPHRIAPASTCRAPTVNPQNETPSRMPTCQRRPGPTCAPPPAAGPLICSTCLASSCAFSPRSPHKRAPAQPTAPRHDTSP